MTIAIVGYAKTGKTAFAEALVRAAVARGMRAAAIKTGREGHGSSPGQQNTATPSVVPDSARFARAGARPSIFWSPSGMVVSGSDGSERSVLDLRLPDRDTFAERWVELLPAPLRRDVAAADLIVIEGRPVAEARIVQMRPIAGRAGLKYPLRPGHIVVAGPKHFDEIIAHIIRPPAADRGGLDGR